MSNTTDKPETNTHWANIFHYLLGSGTLMGCWYGDNPNGLPPFWWRKALRKELESNEAKIASLESQLKEKDREIAALKQAKGMQLVSSEFENGYLREQIKQKEDTLNFYRDQTSKIRELVFNSKDIGKPNQNIFEAVVESIESLRGENTELRQALKFALDNIKESEGSPIFSIILDKARKLIGE